MFRKWRVCIHSGYAYVTTSTNKQQQKKKKKGGGAQEREKGVVLTMQRSRLHHDGSTYAARVASSDNGGKWSTAVCKEREEYTARYSVAGETGSRESEDGCAPRG